MVWVSDGGCTGDASAHSDLTAEIQIEIHIRFGSRSIEIQMQSGRRTFLARDASDEFVLENESGFCHVEESVKPSSRTSHVPRGGIRQAIKPLIACQ